MTATNTRGEKPKQNAVGHEQSECKMPAYNLPEADMKEHTVREFIIPSPNMGKFEERLEKLAKRARRIGCVVPTYTLVRESTKVIQVVIGEEEDSFGRRKDVMGDKVILLNHITIQSPTVVVSGFEFVCTIEHTEEGNILHTIQGKTVPLQYRDCKSWCDHCKVMRRRNDTFIVRHVENNTYLQVGRNCLADFLGRDAEMYAAMAEIYFEVDELAMASEEEGGVGWSSSGPSYDHLDSYLGYVAEVILRDGWRSRTTAREYGGKSTADVAYYIMHPSKEDVREGNLPFRIPSDKSVDQARLAISWCESMSDSEVESSDYLHNIRVIARRGIVGARQLGFAASIVSAYQRSIGELKRKERLTNQAAISNHVGEVGSKMILTLLVEKAIALPDYGYGESTLHLMSDKSGNRFTWKSSTYTLEENKEYVLKCGIKAHEEYKGVKQTKLIRCQKVELKTYSCTLYGAVYSGEAENEKEYKKVLLKTLNLTRLPKGTVVTESVVGSETLAGLKGNS